MTLKPYLAAFFWYIFHEYAWDGFCIWAMKARVGRLPPAEEAAGDPASLEAAGAEAPAEAGADDADPELHAATTRTRAPRAAAPRPKCLETVTCSPPWWLRLKPEVYTRRTAPQGTCLFPSDCLLPRLTRPQGRPEWKPGRCAVEDAIKRTLGAGV